MKLNKFRIFYLFLYALLIVFGVFGICYTLILDSRSFFSATEMLMINIICYGVGIIFNIFQANMVIQSFHNGTLLLNQVCFDINKKRRKLSLVIFLVLFVISLSCSLIFTILRSNPSRNENFLTYDFMIYYSLIILFNMIIALSYDFFLRFDDQTSFK